MERLNPWLKQAKTRITRKKKKNIRFTMQNLDLFEFLVELFGAMCTNINAWLDRGGDAFRFIGNHYASESEHQSVLLGSPSIDNAAYCMEKLLPESRASEYFA